MHHQHHKSSVRVLPTTAAFVCVQTLPYLDRQRSAFPTGTNVIVTLTASNRCR